MSKELPKSPNLLQLKHQAHDLQKMYNQGDESSRKRVIAHHPNLKESDGEKLKRSDAYHVLAREYGFASWSKLKTHVVESQPNHITQDELNRNQNLQTTELSRMAHDTYTAYTEKSLEVYERIRTYVKRFENASRDEIENGIFTMVDAHQLIAMEHGYADWSAFLDSFEDEVDDAFEEAVDAIVEGDNETLRSLLQKHPGLIYAQSSRKHKVTLLHYCSANGVEDFRQKTPPNAVAVMELLLQSGAKADATAKTYYGSESGQTTMNLLVTSYHPQAAGVQGELVKTLVKYGAAVNGLDDDGNPLSAAIAHNCSPAVHALVECGARVDHIIFAAASGNVDYVKQCVNDPAQLQRESIPEKLGCIHLANEPKKIIEQALFFAAKHGQTAVVKYLLDQGTGPNALHHENQTAIHWASYNGHLDCVKLLVDAGANPTVRDKRWNSSAYVWAREDQQNHVMDYLKSKNLIDIFDAVEYGETGTVNQLIHDDPSCVHAPDGLGIPIRIAAYFGYREIAAMLLEHGANPYLQSPDGKTAVDIAIEQGHKDLLPLFEQFNIHKIS